MIWWSLPKSSCFQYFLKACFSWLFIFRCCREGDLRTSDSFWFCFSCFDYFLFFLAFMFCTLVLFWFFLIQGLIWFWLLLPYCKKKKNSITFQIYMYSNKSRNAVFLKNLANWLGYGFETITFGNSLLGLQILLGWFLFDIWFLIWNLTVQSLHVSREVGTACSFLCYADLWFGLNNQAIILYLLVLFPTM